MSAAQRLYAPCPIAVRVDAHGRPQAVAAIVVEAIREDWLVEDQWWSARPLHRHYYELALANGENATVFRDLRGGSWYRQRA